MSNIEPLSLTPATAATQFFHPNDDDEFGRGVIPLGDVNGDGYADFGAQFRKDLSPRDEHGIFVFYGGRNIDTADVQIGDFTAEDGYVIEGGNISEFSLSAISGIGDFDGDGFDDIAFGNHRANANGTRSGEVFLIYGTSELRSGPIDLENFGVDEGTRISGLAAEVQLGSNLDNLGDVNGDGLDDIGIFASEFDLNANSDGAYYVLFGQQESQPATIDLSTLDGSNGFVFRTGPDHRFEGGTGVGDVNGDGFDDVLVGLRDFSLDDLYLIFGTDSGFPAEISRDALPDDVGLVLQGDNSFERFGMPVASPGDFNGDGIGDFAISSSSEDFMGFTANGAAGLFFGQSDIPHDFLSLEGLEGGRGTVFFLEDDFRFAPHQLSFVGDVNGDGFDDLLLSTFGVDFDVPGTVYLVFGRSDPGLGAAFNLETLDGFSGYRFEGFTLTEDFALGAGGLGDVNNDGYDDLGLGVMQRSGGAPTASSLLLVHGGPSNLASLDLADGLRDGRIDIKQNYDIDFIGGPEALAGLGNGTFDGSIQDDVAGLGDLDVEGDPITDGADFLRLRAGNDSVQAAGGDDTLLGETGDDTLQGEAGADLVEGGEGADQLNGGAGDDTLTGGEGPDRFLVGLGEDSTLISDFELGLDILDLTLMARGEATVALAGAQPGSAILTFSDGSTLTVEGEGVTPEAVAAEAGLLLAANAEADGAPLILGTAEEDSELSVDLSSIADADGFDPAGVSYQWLRDGVVLENETESTYTLDQVDVGSAISVEVRFTDNGGTEEVLVSEATAPVENLNDAPQLNGEAYNDQVFEGQFFAFGRGSTRFVDEDPEDTLTLSATLSNGDPLPEWLSFNPADGFFSGTAPMGQEDLEIRLRATDEAGAFADDVFQLLILEGNAPPLGQPLILGDAEEDTTLAADVSAVSDADGIVAGTETYAWLRDGVAIEGATESTFTTRQPDVGAEITLVFGYTDGKGNLESVSSAPSDPIENKNDLPGGAVSGFQFAEVGVPVEYDFSGISDEDGIDESTISYSWRRQDTSFTDQGAIEGATSNIYTPTEADRGFFLVPVFHYTDLFGTEESLDIRGPFVDQPASGVLAISGQVEQGATISADLSGIVEPDGINEGTIDYQWLRDGGEIEGAEAATYVVAAADVGTEVGLRVEYRDLGRKSESFTSEAIRALGPPLLVEGTPGPDSLPGGAGRDTILGLGADDRLIGGAADDLLDGGAGSDTGVFAGPQTSYSLTLSPTQALLTDRRAPEAGGQGTDTLLSIEFLDFDTEIDLFGGNPMNLSIFDGPTTLTAPQFSEIIELYIAYFNRAPDALGLFYWATEFANGFSIPDMAANFFGQPETQATYASVLDASGSLDITDVAKVGAFVTAVYNNVLGRGPDGPGFDYWVEQLQNVPAITPDVFILAIIGGAKFPSNPTEQTAIDQAYLATKSDLGASFAVIKGMSDIADATATMALFDGTDVGRDATLAAIEGHHADALDPITGDFLMPLVGVIDDPFAAG